MFLSSLRHSTTVETLNDKMYEMEMAVSEQYYFKIYLPQLKHIITVQRHFRKSRLIRKFAEVIHKLVLINRMANKFIKLEQRICFGTLAYKIGKMRTMRMKMSSRVQKCIKHKEW